VSASCCYVRNKTQILCLYSNQIFLTVGECILLLYVRNKTQILCLYSNQIFLIVGECILLLYVRNKTQILCLYSNQIFLIVGECILLLFVRNKTQILSNIGITSVRNTVFLVPDFIVHLSHYMFRPRLAAIFWRFINTKNIFKVVTIYSIKSSTKKYCVAYGGLPIFDWYMRNRMHNPIIKIINTLPL
jgi:hypothetical protein